MDHGHWREAFDEVAGAIQALSRLQGNIEKDVKALREDLKSAEDTLMEVTDSISKPNKEEKAAPIPDEIKLQPVEKLNPPEGKEGDQGHNLPHGGIKCHNT